MSPIAPSVQVRRGGVGVGQSRHGFVGGGPLTYGRPLWCTVFQALAVEEDAALVDARSTPSDAGVEDRRVVGADVTRRCSPLHARVRTPDSHVSPPRSTRVFFFFPVTASPP